MTGSPRGAVEAAIHYVARGKVRPRYHANDISRDIVPLAPVRMPIANARLFPTVPGLDREGYALWRNCSRIADFLRVADHADEHAAEMREFLRAVSGADDVVVTGRPILRFSEREQLSGHLDNSRPARFAHIDMSDSTASAFVVRSTGGRPIRRFCYFNVWRAFTGAPQDVPLALCDARSVSPRDLIAADAVFDSPGLPEWSFEGIVVAYNPAHRWAWFPDLTRDEVIVFKTHDSDRARAHAIPHVAFDDPVCPPDAPARASVEMRAVALWWAD